MGIDVKAILDDYGVEYIEMDTRYLVCCPFHDDHDPSCGIYKDTGIFKCFGCHETGGLADFISEFSGIPVEPLRRRMRAPTAIDTLEAKIRAYLDSDESELKYFSKKSFENIYPAILPGSKYWKYLTGHTRHLTASSITRFNIRVGTGKYSNRVVLPIFTEEGKLLSYVARAIQKGVVPKTRKARSPHRTFYGLFELLRDTVTDLDKYTIVVVEGEFDAIYLQQCGVPAISNMGTMPMNSHKIRLLRKYASKVVLSYDPDDAGDAAVYGKATKRGWKSGQYDILTGHFPTEIVDLSDRDPNDLIPEEVHEIYGKYIHST